jgi:putative transposase
MLWCREIIGSRPKNAIVHFEIRESMKEHDVQIVVQRARENYPSVSSRVTSDNVPQRVAHEFKDSIRLTGMTHVRTARWSS